MFKIGNDNPEINYFDIYYIPSVEIEDFNVLIDNKPFLNQTVKNERGSYEKLVKISRNDGYTTGSLLNYSYHQNYYKTNGIVLSKTMKIVVIQFVDFIR